ncbi:MAG: hypothetical protein NUW37_05260 [Planctomycetes bacterium]|nr:hypothetical protein [Planctomycetota bacterium]
MTKVLNGKCAATMEDDALEFIKSHELEDAVKWMEIELPKSFGDEGIEIYLQPEIPEESEEILIFTVICSTLDYSAFREKYHDFLEELETAFPDKRDLIGLVRHWPD